MPELKEQRRSPRFRQDLRVELFDKRGSRVMHAVDVGRHGIFLATDDPPRDRHLVQLLVYLPDGGPIKVAATVTRLVKGQSGHEDGVGVQFFALSEDAKRRWDDFVFILQRTTPNRGVARPDLTKPEPQRPVSDGATFLVKLKTVERLREFAQTHLHSGGTVLFTPVLRAPGEHVTLICVHPRTDEEFHLPGVVHRVHAERPKRLEIHFIGVSATLLNNFTAYVESGHPPRVQLAAPPPAPAASARDEQELDLDVDVFDEDTLDTDDRILRPPGDVTAPPIPSTAATDPPRTATAPGAGSAVLTPIAAPIASAGVAPGSLPAPTPVVDPGLRPDAFLVRCDFCDAEPYAIDLGPCRGVLGLVADYAAFVAKGGRVVGAPRLVSAEERHNRVQAFLAHGGRLDASIDLMTMFGVVSLAEPPKDNNGDTLKHPKAVERLDHVARKLKDGDGVAKTKVKCPDCKDGHVTVERAPV